MPRGVPRVTEAKTEVTEEQAQAIKAANADWKPPKDEEKRVKLTVHRPKDEKADSVFLSVNFKEYQIRFDEEVTVPMSVLDALKATAVVTMVQDPHTEKMTPTRQPRFSYSVEAI